MKNTNYKIAKVTLVTALHTEKNFWEIILTSTPH